MATTTLAGEIVGQEGATALVKLHTPLTGEDCCGGYCGHKLWHLGKSRLLRIPNTQKIPQGTAVWLRWDQQTLLRHQWRLWGIPIGVFLATIPLLPETWWSLLISLIFVGSTAVLLNRQPLIIELTPQSKNSAVKRL